MTMNISNHTRQARAMNTSSYSGHGSMNTSNHSRPGRIPAALQAVFLASNAGEEVNEPPKNLGFKVFSRFNFGGKNKKQVNDKPGKISLESAPIKEERAQLSPQEFLDTALKLRGYSTERYSTINSGYSNMPTELQLVSYDVHILKMVIRDKDEHKLREMLTCGISLNACNKYGELLLHKVCKSGQDKLLQVFLDCGADIQVSDGAGRTPMHDACHGSKPSFKTFELLLKTDPYLICMMDGGGILPLSYVRKEQYGAWNAFLASILDIYWNPCDTSKRNPDPPPLTLVKANSRPAVDPEQPLSFELAALVSSGRMEPYDAIEAQIEAEEDDEDESWATDDEFYFDEDEIEELESLNKSLSAMAA